MSANLPMRPKDLALVGIPPFLLGALRFMLAAFLARLFFKPPKVPLRLYLAYGFTISVGQFAFLLAPSTWACRRAWLRWCCSHSRSC